MEISNENLKKLIVGPGHINEDDFMEIVSNAERKKIKLYDALLQSGKISDDQLGRIIAEFFGYKFIDLRKERIDEKVLHTIPELVARNREAILFKKGGYGVRVAMVDPGDLELIHFIQKRTGGKVYPYMITKDDFKNSILRYESSIQDEFEIILKKLKDPSLTKDQQDEFTIKMVSMLLQYGYQNKASDIHIEPYLKSINIRFRIDGIMHDVISLPKKFGDPMLMRIKILSKMRTDEHMAAQDGKFRFAVDRKDEHSDIKSSETVDIRVSVVPITEGENVVMRILTSTNSQFGLDDIGFSNEDAEKINKAIKHPHGMILVTGPTGSGKTTTLYSIMKILNKREVHISTIEDPVEYDIEGISQIQVNEKTNLTFAKGLRAIVRQDPDIIMIGEIRDEETASIAVNSALTGHLVLSTLHTNDSATTLPRLLDMNVEPFLVTSTVNVVVAQRLIRRICESCKASYSLSDDEKKMIEGDQNIKNLFIKKGYTDLDSIILYKGSGCKVCGDSGYSGRVGIFEILEMDDDIKNLVLKRASSDIVLKTAIKNGMTTMMDDGLTKAFAGMTTISEVFRVVIE